MTRPLDNKETKKNVSFKIEPKVLAKIIKAYGSFSAFVNRKIKADKNIK